MGNRIINDAVFFDGDFGDRVDLMGGLIMQWKVIRVVELISIGDFYLFKAIKSI